MKNITDFSGGKKWQWCSWCGNGDKMMEKESFRDRMHPDQLHLSSCSFCYQVPGRSQGGNDSCRIHGCSDKCGCIRHEVLLYTHRCPHSVWLWTSVWNPQHSSTSGKIREDDISRISSAEMWWYIVLPFMRNCQITKYTLFCTDRTIRCADTAVVA